MIHISQEELLKKIEQEHNQLFEQEECEEKRAHLRAVREEAVGRDKLETSRASDSSTMSYILPTTCSSLTDRNNNAISGEDAEKAVLITGE